MTTLFDATLALARLLGNVRDSTTTGAGTATTVVDSTRTEADDFWNGGTLWVTSGTQSGKSRKITDWAFTGTTFTIPTTSTAVGSSATYSVITADWPQDKLNSFINAALRDIGDVPAEDATLTTVGGQEQYTLPTGVSDVRMVEVAQSEDTPYSYQPIWNWRELPTGELQFDTGREPGDTGFYIRLTYMDAHAVMTADTSTVSTYVHLDRLTWAAAVHAWRWRMQVAKTDEPMYQLFYQEAVAQAEKYKRIRPTPYIPRPVRLSL